MTIPTLKRVKITSEPKLRSWLEKQSGDTQSLMLVIDNKSARKNDFGRDQVNAIIGEYGWANGGRYCLNKDLIGHVIHRTD